MIKTYGPSSMGRTVWAGLMLLGAANMLCHFVSLLMGPQSETVSAGTHVGASLFVMVISVGMVLFGVSGLRARLAVDATGMRRERPWILHGLDIRWEQVESWGLRTVVTTSEMHDEWGATVTTETRSERLEIALNTPLSCIRLIPGSPFFREIVEALRAHVPTKEQALPVEKA